MSITFETEAMAKPKGRPKSVESDPPAGRVTIINLKGSEAQAAWLEEVHARTHIAKAVIVRLALSSWAEQNRHPPFPSGEGDL